MDNNDLDEKEKKSLLKDMSKKGISKKIKTMPLKTKLIIFGIVFGVVFFLLIFIVLASALSMLLLFDNEEKDKDSNLVYVESNSEDNYWWPIGGTTIEEKNGIEYATGTPSSLNVTSEFSPSRTIDGRTSAHYGMDIGGNWGITDYVIATMKGTVYTTSNGCPNNGYYGNTCGGGYGNYVIIEHPGNVYTIYAHLYPNSIKVSQGDVVNQGQIIAEMGNSGSSTGKHLHFQIEVGGRGSQYAVNPRDYVFVDNPRPVTIPSAPESSGEAVGNNEMLRMLQILEGGDQYISGDYCIVYDDGYGYLSVGHGVALSFNTDKFNERGIDVSKLSVGSKIKKTIVDEIEIELVNEKKASVISLLQNNNITLEDYQIDALVIRMYNVGNVNAFPSKYKQYGNTQALYDNYMSKPNTSNNQYSLGLDRRRQAEWNLFHNGIYTFNY